jgi:hypothetical protein
MVFMFIKSRHSSVGIALGYGLDDRGSRVQFPAGAGNFLLTTESRPALRPTQPPIQGVPGALSLGVKRSGREANHSPPSSAQYVFMARCLVKHRDKFTFTFTLMFIYSTFKNIHLFHPIYRVPKSCGK